MHKQVNILTICIGALILSSCARTTDYTLSPPLDALWVNSKVKSSFIIISKNILSI